MQTLAAILLVFVLPLLFLAAVCSYGPLEDRIKDRHRDRRRQPEREVHRPKATARLSQPGWGIAQWTTAGWAEVVAIGGTGR